MRILLFVFFLLNYFYLGAQTVDQTIDDILSTDTLDDKQKASLLRQKGEAALQAGDTVVLPFFNKAENLALKTDAFQELGYIYLLKANYFFIKVEYDSARYYFSLMGSVSDSLDDPWFRNTMYHGIGTAYYGENELDSALVYYLKAQAGQEAANDLKNAISTALNIGAIYRNLENSDSALAIFERAVEDARKLDAPNYELVGLINLLNIQVMMGNAAEVLDDTRALLSLIENYPDEYYKAEGQKGAASVFIRIDSVHLAEPLLNKALAYERKVQNKRGLSDIYREFALLHGRKGNEEIALSYLDSSLAVDTSQANRSIQLQARSRVYEFLGNHKKALEDYKEYKAVFDSLVNVESIRDLNTIREKFEAEKKQRIIAEQKQALKESELKLARRNLQITVILVSLVVLALILIVLYERKKRRLQAEKDASIIEEREKGLEAIIIAQEEERRRIGADLHDGLTQNLGAIDLQLKKLVNDFPGDPKADKLIHIEKVLSESISEIRTLSHQMRPYALENLGLKEALKELLEKSLYGTDIEFEFEELNVPGRLPERVSITLYRIAQELLNNTIKHSGAKLVALQLIQTDKFLIMILEDNGIGMDQSNSGGQGLLNIKSRLNGINGDVQLASSQNAGTSVTIRIPATDLEK